MSEKTSRKPREAVEAIVSPQAPNIPQQTLNEDPGLLAQLFERYTPTGRDALSDKPLLPVRTITFTIDGSLCAPNVFVDAEGNYFDFRLTMRSLGSDDELEALDKAVGGATVPMSLTKAMLWKMNGKVITPRQRDWLWEALDMRGRGLCFTVYQQMAGASQSVLGKFQASFTVG